MDRLTRIINEGRARTNLTVGDLCDLMGVHKSMFYRHLKGKGFTVAELRRMAKVLYLSDGEIVEIIRGK